MSSPIQNSPGIVRAAHAFAMPPVCVLCILWVVGSTLGCDTDTTVPFKRPAAATAELGSINERTGSVVPSRPAGASSDSSGSSANAGAKRSFRFPVATHKAALPDGMLDGGQLTIHAAWRNAEDGSSRNGAIVLTTSPEGALAMHVVKRTARGYGALRSPLALPAPSTDPSTNPCTVLSGGLTKPTPGHFIAETSFSCSEPDDAPATLRRTYFLISAQPHLRLLERITLHSTAEAHAPAGMTANLSLEVFGEDLDGDSQPDLRLTLTPQLDGHPLEPIHVQLIDRPGGLTLVGNEPEASLLKRADLALESLKGKPSTALEVAGQVAALHAALCRGSGTARLSLGARNGLPCPRSVALGRALAVTVTAHVRAGELAHALQAWEAMRDPKVRVTRKDEARAESALDGVPKSRHYRFEPGPTLPHAQKPSLFRPPAVFLDEHRLLLRGTPPASLTLGETAPTPTSVAAPGFQLRSPDNRFVATEIVRDCSGDHLQLFAADQVVMGRTLGKPAMQIPLSIIPHRAGCSSLSRPRRVKPGSWNLLRWTTSGLVLLHHGKLMHVPLDANLKGGPAVVPSASWRPSGSPEPDAIADAPGLIPVLTRRGIGLLSIAGGKLELIGTEGLPKTLNTLALSPSGERIVASSAQRVYLGTRVLRSSSRPPAP